MGCSHSTQTIIPQSINNDGHLQPSKLEKAVTSLGIYQDDGLLNKPDIRKRMSMDHQQSTNPSGSLLCRGDSVGPAPISLSKETYNYPSSLVTPRRYSVCTQRAQYPSTAERFNREVELKINSRDLRIVPVRCEDCPACDHAESVVSPVLADGHLSEEESPRNLSAGQGTKQGSGSGTRQVYNFNSTGARNMSKTFTSHPALTVDGSKYKKPSNIIGRKMFDLNDSHESVVHERALFKPSNSSRNSQLPESPSSKSKILTTRLSEDEVKSLAIKVRDRLRSRNIVDSKTVINSLSNNSSQVPVCKDLIAVFEFAKELKMGRCRQSVQ